MMRGGGMRTTINIDEALYKRAMEFTGITSKTELLNRGLQELIARQAARELAKMGGLDPSATVPSRQRVWTEDGTSKP